MSQLLDGRYQLIQVLGSDSLGRTYLVSDTQLPDNPKRIIKHLQLPDGNPRTLSFALTLLKKKAETLKKLNRDERTSHILGYFDDAKNFYLIEEFVSGVPLQQQLLSGVPWSEPEVIPLLWEILEILALIHGWGLVHRGIKPSNLIRRQSDNKLVLTGFGIFKEISAQTTRSSLGVSETSLNGGSAYISPDQLQGQLQFNTDIYAIGMIAIQALTGLAASELAQRLQDALSQDRQLPWQNWARVSPEFAAILDKMIHPDSKQRYQLVAEVLDDLRHLNKSHSQILVNRPPSQILSPTPPGQPTQIPQRPAPSNRSSPSSQFPWKWSIASLAVLGLSLGLILSQLPQRFVAQRLIHQGDQHGQNNQHEDAIDSYTQALNLRPSSEGYYRRAMAALAVEDPQMALEDLTQAITLDGNQVDLFYQRGNVRFELGDRQGALADYTQAIRLDPQFTRAYVNRGNVRADLGDEQGAAEDYTQAIQIDPNLADAYLNRCLSRSNLDDHQGAIADCTQAINLRPNSLMAYQNRGLVRRRLGDLTGAIADFNIAIRLDPTDPDPYYNRGLVRQELGDRDGAIADYTTAIQHDPNHVFAYYDRGVVRAEAGDAEGAIMDLQKSATLCLNSGRMGCYEDAQYQLRQLQSPPVE